MSCALQSSYNLQKTLKTLLQGHHFIHERGCPLTSFNKGGFHRFLSSGEAFTALKPFFFAVHPDLFGQHPRERAVNENSLKQLNEYIESTSQHRSVQPTRLVFYLRRESSKERPSPTPPPSPGNFKSVRIDLGHKDVRQTVYSILETCNLSTSYVDSLPKSLPPKQPLQNPFAASHEESINYWRPPSTQAAEADIRKKKTAQDNLEFWLNKNVDPARKKLSDCWPIREEITKLQESICDSLELESIIWDCGWGTRHFRGCLQSFRAMAAHHPEHMEALKDRTVVFGRGETGVSLDGHVILNSGEVRANWLDLIKRVRNYDHMILRVPKVESALSTALKDIKVVHRKFEPTRLADTYEVHLKKLTTSIGDYRGKSSFPSHWPEKLSNLELVVETEAGPLMISPTGQIIVPSSCPGFLLVNFISDHMEEAIQKLELYKTEKYIERDMHERCVKVFGLVALQKDDNVTPTLMIECCSRLLERYDELSTLLKGTHLWITTYFSVLSDGEICIPWNWKE